MISELICDVSALGPQVPLACYFPLSAPGSSSQLHRAARGVIGAAERGAPSADAGHLVEGVRSHEGVPPRPRLPTQLLPYGVASPITAEKLVCF